MLLLCLQLRLQAPLTFAPHEAPFKGGVLHGMVEHALTQHHPQLWGILRSATNQPAHYALRVPQDSDTHWPEGHAFELGLMLFAPVQALWGDVLDALTPAHTAAPLALGHARAPCSVVDVRIHRPNAPALSLLQAMGHSGAGLAHWQAQRPHTAACPQLRITLQAPCFITSDTRRAQAHSPPMPLTLSSIVRSVQRRIEHLEPTLAEQYRCDSPEWQEALRSTWPHQIATAAHTHISPRPWPYASRNTPGKHPITIAAIEGHMHYTGPTPEAITSLLHIGQWIGIGQKNSLGMGWFGVDLEMIDTEEKSNA